MLVLFSYILKISFSLASTYVIIYFINDKDEIIDYSKSKNITLFILIASAFINLLFIFSKQLDNYTSFYIGLIIFSFLVYKFIRDKVYGEKLIGFLCYFSIISICIGYFSYSLLVLILFYLLNKNYYLLNETKAFTSKNTEDQNIELEKDE